MDCRKPMIWSLALLGGLTGCTSTGTNNNTPASAIVPPQQLSQIDPALIKKASDQPTQKPPAKLCDVWGNFAAGEAANMGGSSVLTNDARDQARKAYQQAIRIDPKYLDAYLGLAKLYMTMDDDDHAIATLKEAAKQHPEAAGVWFMTGMVYSRRKTWEPALANLTRAAELEPENRTYVDTLGHALAHAGKTQEALAVYKRVNSEAKSFFNLARVMQHMNQTELSREYLQTALLKDPRLQAEAQDLLTQLYGGAPADAVQQTSYAPSVPPSVNVVNVDAVANP
jgi:Tfp pilus assembly protein PilF